MTLSGIFPLSGHGTLYDHDRGQNLNTVYMPDALEKQYPNAGKEWRCGGHLGLPYSFMQYVIFQTWFRN
jgi:hypothetical protein